MVHLAMTLAEDSSSLDPGQIPLALLGRHRAAHIVEMLQHLALTIGAEQGRFCERFLDLGCDGIRAGQQML